MIHRPSIINLKSYILKSKPKTFTPRGLLNQNKLKTNNRRGSRMQNSGWWLGVVPLASEDGTHKSESSSVIPSSRGSGEQRGFN
jgi:hypothetical protein